MRKRDYLLSGCLFAIGLGISCGAMACATGQWDVTSGSAVAGSPEPVGTTPRVEQLCGLAIGAAPGYVQDDSPLGSEDTRIRIRFYFLAEAPGEANQETTILRVFGDDAGSNEAFTISYQTSGDNKISFNPSNGTASAVTAPSGWVLVEVDWNVGNDYLRYWVNASPEGDESNFTGETDAGDQTHVGMVRLGAPDGRGDLTKLVFDSYQANRSNPIGGLLIGDASGDGQYLGSDLIVIKKEVLQQQLAPGLPDCTRDGQVLGSDLICTKKIILSPPP